MDSLSSVFSLWQDRISPHYTFALAESVHEHMGKAVRAFLIAITPWLKKKYMLNREIYFTSWNWGTEDEVRGSVAILFTFEYATINERIYVPFDNIIEFVKTGKASVDKIVDL